MFIGKFIQFSVGMRRIQKFLLSKELSLLKNIQDSEEAVKVDGSFNWGNNIYDHATLLEKRKSLGAKTEDKILSEFELTGLNLKVSKGKFICILGDVGSGKSSLLQAIIGDLVGSGQVSLSSSLAYFQ